MIVEMQQAGAKKDSGTSKVEELIREAFKVNWLFGRIAHDDHGFRVWGKGLISEEIAQIITGYQTLYVFYRKHGDRAKIFEKLYKEIFSPVQSFCFKSSYD